jgi:outer membrane protein OmpA-like peptidoglycan-associated protein
MLRRNLTLMALALLASGCASRTGISLLPGEATPNGNKPVGAVAFLDPETGADLGVVDTANARAGVKGGKVAVKAMSDADMKARYGDLLAAMPEPPRLFVLYFKEGSTELVDESTQLIPDLFDEVKRRPGVDVQVVGHTDTVGEGTSNDALSVKRAEEVRARLVSMGLAPDLVRATGRGERELVEPTPDEVASLFNRRVEVLVK